MYIIIHRYEHKLPASWVSFSLSQICSEFSFFVSLSASSPLGFLKESYKLTINLGFFLNVNSF